MSYTCFDVDIKDRIAHIKLIRPEKRNSMNPAFWDELPAIVKDIDRNVKARVIVISSTGPHFSAGLDVSAFFNADGRDEKDQDTQQVERIGKGAAFYENVQRMQDTFSCLENCRLPVIVAIQGGCIGGGVDFATACDIRYATADAFFTVFEINIGMTADVGTFPRLVKLIPEGFVRELAYTGRRMPAHEAQSVGLVNRVFDDQEIMLEEVMKIASEIASKAPLALYGCKRMINYARDHNTADGLDYISIWNASFLQPEEIMEAMAANAERRAGNFVELPKIKKTTE
ncbi:MAG: crotonase/enoyl-CoA hydratase family protein [Gammaproteobacteria bacterium]|nr:crotonase/enoyl-CoA hydratase family protein [Gammaproteobacteria bacterium]